MNLRNLRTVGSIVGLFLSVPLRGQTTQRVDVSSAGVQANAWSTTFSISMDGRFVTIRSLASNLDPADSNGVNDVFVRDRIIGATERISVSTSGQQGNGESGHGWITPDGRFVAFSSYASNLVAGDGNGTSDAFIRDRRQGTTELISANTAGIIGNGASGTGPVTPDGRYVTFVSLATNLAPGVPPGYEQVYVRDRLNGTTELASISTAGAIGNNSSWSCSISGNGRFVAFVSYASNLVSGDTNNRADAFVRDRQNGTTDRVSLTAGGGQTDGSSWELAMSD